MDEIAKFFQGLLNLNSKYDRTGNIKDKANYSELRDRGLSVRLPGEGMVAPRTTSTKTEKRMPTRLPGYILNQDGTADPLYEEDRYVGPDEETAGKVTSDGETVDVTASNSDDFIRGLNMILNPALQYKTDLQNRSFVAKANGELDPAANYPVTYTDDRASGRRTGQFKELGQIDTIPGFAVSGRINDMSNYEAKPSGFKELGQIDKFPGFAKAGQIEDLSEYEAKSSEKGSKEESKSESKTEESKTEEAKPVSNKKWDFTDDELARAKDVIQLKYGYGQDRFNRLANEGYDPARVQRLVNEIVEGGERSLYNSGTASTGAPMGQTYKIKAGDSLWQIAQETGTTVDQLRQRNGLKPGDTIHPGQIINIQ